MTMQVRNWQDMKRYGVRYLTGEACTIGNRALFDLTEPGRDLIAGFFDAVPTLRRPYNGDGAIGAMMLPKIMLTALAVAAMLWQDQCVAVYVTEDGAFGITREEAKERPDYNDQMYHFHKVQSVHGRMR